jgi:hypothetical protein
MSFCSVGPVLARVLARDRLLYMKSADKRRNTKPAMTPIAMPAAVAVFTAFLEEEDDDEEVVVELEAALVLPVVIDTSLLLFELEVLGLEFDDVAVVVAAVHSGSSVARSIMTPYALISFIVPVTDMVVLLVMSA